MKKQVSIFMSALLAVGCVGCGTQNSGESNGSNENKGNTHIYVLTAPEDHGWTGSVSTFAKEKIEEVNGQGKYEAELITSADAAEQIVNIEDIISRGEENIAVVIQPIDDTVQSAISQLIDEEIPYVAFDRIISGVDTDAISNVKGDNEGIGVATAAYFVSCGMQPGEKVYVYEGDTSSVTALRDEGFTKYLTGELEYEGKKIDDSVKWTEEDLKAILILKDESKKRFILDYNTVPKPETQFSSDNQKYEEEIAVLKDENIKLKRKMLQLLELVKRNDQQ